MSMNDYYPMQPWEVGTMGAYIDAYMVGMTDAEWDALNEGAYYDDWSASEMVVAVMAYIDMAWMDAYRGIINGVEYEEEEVF